MYLVNDFIVCSSLEKLIINDYESKPPDNACASPPFNYSHVVHVITGDHNIVENISLRNVFAKGRKFREPQSINWKFNFKIIMDYVMIMPESGQSQRRGRRYHFRMGEGYEVVDTIVIHKLKHQ